MKLKRREWTILVPGAMQDIWHFFSRPENLDSITPADMSFKIITPVSGVDMYPGMLIQYQIRPLLGIKMNWVTEITQIEEESYFIDEQRFGPYAFWHHQHHFKEVNGGVEMTDILHYKVPYGLLGSIADQLFVHQKIEDIFSYRTKVIQDLFPVK